MQKPLVSRALGLNLDGCGAGATSLAHDRGSATCRPVDAHGEGMVVSRDIPNDLPGQGYSNSRLEHGAVKKGDRRALKA